MAYKILVCDDAAFHRMMLCDILKRSGYLIAAEAASGEEAVKLYEKERPDLVFLDITMPKMDGMTALKKILQLDKTAVVLMMAAMGQDSYAKECVALGAKGAVVKPFQEKRVLESLKKVFG